MLNQLNTNLFNAVNQFAGKSIIIDTLNKILAEYLIFGFIFVIIILWFKNIHYKRISLYAVYSAVLGLLLNFLIACFYFHPRPFMAHIGTLLIRHLPETSFPSDHTTFFLSIAFALLFFKKTRKIGAILAVLGFIGGIARIYCGLHYPFDIFGSVIVAIISSGLIFSFKRKLDQTNKTIITLYHKILKKIL